MGSKGSECEVYSLPPCSQVPSTLPCRSSIVLGRWHIKKHLADLALNVVPTLVRCWACVGAKTRWCSRQRNRVESLHHPAHMEHCPAGCALVPRKSPPGRPQVQLAHIPFSTVASKISPGSPEQSTYKKLNRTVLIKQILKTSPAPPPVLAALQSGFPLPSPLEALVNFMWPPGHVPCLHVHRDTPGEVPRTVPEICLKLKAVGLVAQVTPSSTQPGAHTSP